MSDSPSPDDDLLDYLSPEWLIEADRALSDLRALPDPVTVRVRVVHGSATTGYNLVLGPDRVALQAAAATDGEGAGSPAGAEAGRVDGSTAQDEAGRVDGSGRGSVRLTMPMAVAASIARGEASAQRAFLDGRIQLGGDTTLLLGHQRQLAEIDDRLATLRSRTRFPQAC